MNKVTYSAANWSGEEFKATINPRTFKSTSGFSGTYKITEYKDIGRSCVVVIEEIELLVVEYEKDYWVCDDTEFSGISREANNPVIAALQVAHNVI